MQKVGGSIATRVNWASLFANAHEMNDFGSVDMSRRMDFHNNQVGGDYFSSVATRVQFIT